MKSLLSYIRKLFQKAPLTPLRFPTSGFETIPEDIVVEEERFDDFQKGAYCPVNIGDVFASKYQVLGKLGYGVSSTVWLARNLQNHEYATLKVYTRGDAGTSEFNIFKTLSKGDRSHPGFVHVRTALDMFTIPRAGGDHECLVQKPMFESFKDLLNRIPAHRFPETVLKPAMVQVFLALDYLHNEGKLVHTDIKADNILIEIEDKSILESFVQAELSSPSPRKSVNGTTIYASRTFDFPKTIGKAVLGDFGSAARGDLRQSYDAQPDVYRSPEVMLETDWSYPIDIWNVGCMVWDLFEDAHLFSGRDPQLGKYMTRAHLAEVIAMLGPPPLDLLQRGERSKEFFDEEGKFIADATIPDVTLAEREENYSDQTSEKEEFITFMRDMLTWRPEDRKTAKEMLESPYLKNAGKIE